MPDWESALIELKAFFAPLPLRNVLRTINFLTGCADWRNDDASDFEKKRSQLFAPNEDIRCSFGCRQQWTALAFSSPKIMA
jgi:hypothetical protein